MCPQPQPSERPSAERVRNAAFAANLRRLMRERGLGASDLASKIGVSRQSVNQWLTAQNGPTNRRLAQVANAFGVDIERLILPAEAADISRHAGGLSAEADDTIAVKQVEPEQAGSVLESDIAGADEKPARTIVWRVPPSAVSDEASNQTTTVIIRVTDNALDPEVRAGDHIFTDVSYRAVIRPGVYLIMVAGSPAWRRCSPLLGQKVLVEDRFVKQEVVAADLEVLGRAVRLVTHPLR